MERKPHSKLYDTYIRSDAWKYKKAQREQIDENKCVMCGRDASTCKNGLSCHHIRYYRNGKSILGHENVWKDLVTLCPACHKKLHNFIDRKQ